MGERANEKFMLDSRYSLAEIHCGAVCVAAVFWIVMHVCNFDW